jgi:uncharacterized membrane protein YsdA (DUF1294 family)
MYYNSTPIAWFLELAIFTQLFIVALIIINIITFFAFGIDKIAASLGQRRTPEKALWILTALGGSLGALAGMEFFKHKRRKVSFYSIITIFFLVHILLLLLALQ